MILGFLFAVSLGLVAIVIAVSLGVAAESYTDDEEWGIGVFLGALVVLFGVVSVLTALVV